MDLLKNLAESVADIIGADPYFWELPRVEVFSAWAADRVQRLQMAGGAVQSCVVVGITEVSFAGAEHVDPPQLPNIKVTVLCLENLALKSGKSADNMALAAAGALVLSIPDGCNEPTELVSIRPVPASEFPVPLANADNFQVVALEVNACLASDYAPDTAADVEITEENGLVTITSEDGGEIRYTLDGTRPTPVNGAVYAGPLTCAEGATVRARAYVAEKRASAIADHTVEGA